MLEEGKVCPGVGVFLWIMLVMVVLLADARMRVHWVRDVLLDAWVNSERREKYYECLDRQQLANSISSSTLNRQKDKRP